jgi:valacyclovir hydrolase
MPKVQVTAPINGRPKTQTMYYQTFGAGDPVMIMHGWTDTSDDLRDLSDRLVAAGYRTILPDLPGYGQSVPPERDYTPTFYHDDAHMMGAFLRALGFSAENRVHVFGFSDGGEVALLMPIFHPDVVRSCVAWGAVGNLTPALCERVRRALPHKWPNEAYKKKHSGQDVYSWDVKWVDAYCAMVEAGGDISIGRAHEIVCPLLLMIGDSDGLNPIPLGHNFMDAAKTAPIKQFRVFAGTGHPIHEEQPIPFTTTVLEFLKQVP